MSSSRARADVLFVLYQQAGPARSLVGLHEQAAALGLNVSVSTLKRYSKQFGWQERLEAIDRAAAEHDDERAAEAVRLMNERQAQLGRSLQGVAATALQSYVRDRGQLDEVRPGEVARLAEAGTKLERLALGEATERQEVVVTVWNVVVRELVPLFASVNALSAPDERAAAFARGLDELVDQHLASGR